MWADPLAIALSFFPASQGAALPQMCCPPCSPALDVPPIFHPYRTAAQQTVQEHFAAARAGKVLHKNVWGNADMNQHCALLWKGVLWESLLMGGCETGMDWNNISMHNCTGDRDRKISLIEEKKPSSKVLQWGWREHEQSNMLNLKWKGI